MKATKDPNVKGRKYNGHPYLKLHRVRQSPRVKIRQLLRSFVSLEIAPPAATTENSTTDH